MQYFLTGKLKGILWQQIFISKSKCNATYFIVIVAHSIGE